MKTEQTEIVKKVDADKYRRTAGGLIFAFTTQFAILMIVAEALYPNYSVANNYISDLGVRTTGSLFDTSISVLGLAVIVSSYLIYKVFGSRIFTTLVALIGIGALSVGIFNESFTTVHGLASLLTFVAGAVTAIYAYRFTRPPLNYFSVVMGVASLGALIVFLSGTTYGLGVGGVERMIVYPFIFWGLGFGGYLMGSSQTK